MIQLESSNCCPFLSRAGYQLNQQPDPNPSAVRIVVMEGNAHPELASARASGEMTNLLLMYRRPWRANTSVTKDDGKADTWLPSCCTDLPKAVPTDQERVSTPPRPCMKVRICKLHGAEQGNWFWPIYTNTIQGNCSNAGSGCL